MASQARGVIVAVDASQWTAGCAERRGIELTRDATRDVPRTPKALVLNCLSCRRMKLLPDFPSTSRSPTRFFTPCRRRYEQKAEKRQAETEELLPKVAELA